MNSTFKLSILDQSPIRKGITATQALKESVELAKLADSLGYSRYWLSEHHNTKTLAGTAPEILIARLASETSNIRVGSGGVMLPNHSTLKVAENFRLLEALFPGRIDLGIGRAPGGDRVTAHLLNPANSFDPNEFVRQIYDLIAFLTDADIPDSVHQKVKAMPQTDTVPEMWMLTSSGESGLLAAHFGMSLSFAQFINPVGGVEAINSYKERFKPSELLAEPQANVGIFVFCAETEEKAAQMQAVMDYRLISLEKGKPDNISTFEEIQKYQYMDWEWQRMKFNRGRMIAGTPDVVKERLISLAKSFDVDEIVIATITEDHADRLRSYELLAEAFELIPDKVSDTFTDA